MGQQQSSRQNLQEWECSCSGGCSPVSGGPSGSREQLDTNRDCHNCGRAEPEDQSSACSDTDCRVSEPRATPETSGDSITPQNTSRSVNKIDCLRQDLSSLGISQRCCCSTGDLCKKTSSVDRYVSALVSRGCWRSGASPSSSSSSERRRRRRGGWTTRFGAPHSPHSAHSVHSVHSSSQPNNRCVCTAYRRVHEDQLPNGAGTVCRWTTTAVLAVGDSQHPHSADRIDAADTTVSTPVILVSLPASGGAPLLDLARLERLTSEASDANGSSDPNRQRRNADSSESHDGTHNYQRPHFQVVCVTDRRAIFVSSAASAAPLLPPSPPNEPLPSTLGHPRIHMQVDYAHCLVPDLQAITACAFYWGKMDRYEAERLLDGRPEGTFLLRDSAQEDHLFSVSFRKYGRSLHARIEHFDHRFSFDSHDPGVYAAPTVTGLIEHYKDPACVMFFEPMLTWPLARAQPFALQQLARAAIASRTSYDGVGALPLPASLQAYLKEYHYRQKVRVTRFDDAH